LQLKENCGSKENCDLFSSTAVEVVLADPKNLYQREIKSYYARNFHSVHSRVMEFAARSSILCASDNNEATVLLPTHREGKPSWQMSQS
jgi:hypothetical protein